MISTRYVPAVCALVAAALVPTAIHSYVGSVVVDGRQTSSIATALAGYTSTPANRDVGWGTRRFASTDWFERSYRAGGDDVQLTVIRSYDHKLLYHHPELDIAYGTSFLRHETVRLTSHPQIPVHVLHSDTENGPMALYVLHYNNAYIDDPLWFQIRIAGELLISGRKPMTLLFARDTHAARSASAESLGAARVLTAAIDQFVVASR